MITLHQASFLQPTSKVAWSSTSVGDLRNDIKLLQVPNVGSKADLWQCCREPAKARKINKALLKIRSHNRHRSLANKRWLSKIQKDQKGETWPPGWSQGGRDQGRRASVRSCSKHGDMFSPLTTLQWSRCTKHPFCSQLRKLRDRPPQLAI